MGPVLFKGDKDVNVAAEGGPAKTEGLSTSGLLLLNSAHLHQSQQQINTVSLNARGKGR